MAINLLQWWLDNVISVKGLNTVGERPLTMEDTVWVDIVGAPMGRSFDANKGHIDYNYDTGNWDFDNTANVTNNEHALTTLFQLYHEIFAGTGACLRPHAHFLDEDIINKPLFKVEYMIMGRGAYVGVPWTELPASGFTFAINNTVNGREEIVSFGDIPIDGIPISGQVKVRVWRDGANDSAPAEVGVSFIDCHAPKIYLGSKTEFVQ